jgi:uncharacterized coiled-coil DUF342 family protein
LLYSCWVRSLKTSKIQQIRKFQKHNNRKKQKYKKIQNFKNTKNNYLKKMTKGSTKVNLYNQEYEMIKEAANSLGIPMSKILKDYAISYLKLHQETRNLNLSYLDMLICSYDNSSFLP